MKLKDLERDIKMLEEAISGAESISPRIAGLNSQVDHLKDDLVENLQHMGQHGDKLEAHGDMRLDK